eukprot:INCI14096.3.p2 GENE.INCI14096.3~~INCI14096.3.p2  ORF type:complete len:114 (-),score=3.44 INCI14096.3:103-444(-)
MNYVRCCWFAFGVATIRMHVMGRVSGTQWPLIDGSSIDRWAARSPFESQQQSCDCVFFFSFVRMRDFNVLEPLVPYLWFALLCVYVCNCDGRDLNVLEPLWSCCPTTQIRSNG